MIAADAHVYVIKSFTPEGIAFAVGIIFGIIAVIVVVIKRR